MNVQINHKYLDGTTQEVRRDELNVMREWIEGMFELCEGKLCIGLAANQIGLNKRLMVINCQGFKQVFINPVIERAWGGTSGMKEQCLSFPKKTVWVMRYKRIRIVGVDENWDKVRFKPRGLPCRVMQHEYDHLHGISMMDRSEMGRPRYG